ncbi:TIGR03857 family LLM class F420-dependent oxidoreductase [Mycobacterium arosiense]|uniref:LLM class F420-dependent oxidoreductase n=1 Tax=Mycobacterium arosiense ATCC BAA-1401 = DSM 45069 TaxID=1265311 RepID=A0A1W9Z640_MYCAI|nr:TIGR03857 family LLM class F420-dependent oxidoreductase [Mycobacterium arosiense]ORA07619.1 LLM class F420-dependent oxidoreductase [Mycobacterium arosiense ATCC BAA-1401 = DSM 45069]
MTTTAAVELEPVIDDLAVYLMPGRVKGPAPGHGAGPRRALDEAVDAERLGIKTAFLTERYDLKNAPALLGGIGAVTTRLEIGTSPIVTSSRPPIVIAGFAATMQAAFGERFILGLGRGITEAPDGAGLLPFGDTAETFADYVQMIKTLLRGEVVNYDGPAGRFRNLRMVDTLEGPPPPIWYCAMGGPKACKLAAHVADGLMLMPMLTAEATERAVKTFREERERIGLDPNSAQVCQSVVTACELDEVKTANITSARFVTYVVGGYQFLAKRYVRANGWDMDVIRRIGEHPMFGQRGQVSPSADESFYRSQLLEPGALVPEEWMQESCAIGSVEKCVSRWQDYRRAGADQIMLYGSTPADSVKLIDAWRRESNRND